MVSKYVGGLVGRKRQLVDANLDDVAVDLLARSSPVWAYARAQQQARGHRLANLANELLACAAVGEMVVVVNDERRKRDVCKVCKEDVDYFLDLSCRFREREEELLETIGELRAN
jgi:hypothetical protein